MVKRLLVCLIAIAALSVFAKEASAEAFEYRFGCITTGSAADCSILETQLFVEIGQDAAGSVYFKVRNAGPAASSMTAVYFDDLSPALLAFPTSSTFITDSGAGVSFSAPCNPSGLPGGNEYGFSTSYCADSDNPTQPMGVNPNEWVKLTLTLQGDADLLDVLKAVEAGSFRIGIRVQGFSDQGSVAGIVNTLPVPEPASIVLLSSGAVAAFVRRRRRQAA